MLSSKGLSESPLLDRLSTLSPGVVAFGGCCELVVGVAGFAVAGFAVELDEVAPVDAVFAMVLFKSESFEFHEPAALRGGVALRGVEELYL